MARRVVFVRGGDGLPPELTALESRPGYSVVTADGAGDLETAIGERTACVVTDHDPPDVDGLAVAARVAERYPSLPVILFPEVHDEALATAAVNGPVAAFLPQREEQQTDALCQQIERVTAQSVPRLDVDDDGILDSLLGSIPRWVAIYAKDRLGRHVAVSGGDYHEEGTSITTPDGAVLHHPQDVLGKTDFDLYPRELAVQTLHEERRIAHTEEPLVDKSETVERPDGTTGHYSATKAPWYDSAGNVVGIVGITVNITDRVEHQHQLERQNERLDRFANVLSHDIRNPLTLARGQLETAKEHPIPVPVAEAHRDVEWALDRIDELVDETLALARNGAVVDDPEPTDLDAVARAAWQAAGADADGVELDLRTGEQVIEADGERLQTLLENLARNAMDHGGTALSRLRVGPLSDGFYVEDDGQGIPEADRATVLEEGYTTDASGTGFGLSIVQEIADAHGWELRVDDSSSGGARFEFHDVVQAGATV